MDAALPTGDVNLSDREVLARMSAGVPPADVNEYMQRVRLEASILPDVVKADLDEQLVDTKAQNGYMPALELPVECHEQLLPSREWEIKFLADFAEIRQVVYRWSARRSRSAPRVLVPVMRDVQGWRHFCFGTDGESKVDNAPTTLEDLVGVGGEEQRAAFGTPPLLQLMTQFDQVLTRRLLTLHVGWLCEDMDESDEEKDGRQKKDLTPSQTLWLYAILCRLDKPVHADVSALLRELVRRVCQLRAGLWDKLGAHSRESSELACVNMILSIAGRFFGQSEECAGNFLPESEEVLKEVHAQEGLEGDEDGWEEEDEDIEL